MTVITQAPATSFVMTALASVLATRMSLDELVTSVAMATGDSRSVGHASAMVRLIPVTPSLESVSTAGTIPGAPTAKGGAAIPLLKTKLFYI